MSLVGFTDLTQSFRSLLTDISSQIVSVDGEIRNPPPPRYHIRLLNPQTEFYIGQVFEELTIGNTEYYIEEKYRWATYKCDYNPVTKGFDRAEEDQIHVCLVLTGRTSALDSQEVSNADTSLYRTPTN